MKILNEAKIIFASRSTNESFARVCGSAFFCSVDPTVEEICDIKTAISEAVTNSIVHGYKNEFGKIYMTMRLLEGNIVYIKIRDLGCGIPDIKQAMQPLFTTSKNDERAGLGFAVMQSFMDKVKVYSNNCKGTTVVMVKQLSQK